MFSNYWHGIMYHDWEHRANSKKGCITSLAQRGQRGVESCAPQQVEEYCKPDAQGGAPPRYGGQQWKLVDKQTKCMPPLGYYGHLGQWTRGQSNCPPPPHGHCKHQGQWAIGYQGQWNNYCERMATNQHGHANWMGLVVVTGVPYRADGLVGLV